MLISWVPVWSYWDLPFILGDVFFFFFSLLFTNLWERFACEQIQLLFHLRPTGSSQDYSSLGPDKLGVLTTSDSLYAPTCAGDIVLLQDLVVSAGTHSASWDGEAEGTAASIIHTACVFPW